MPTSLKLVSYKKMWSPLLSHLELHYLGEFGAIWENAEGCETGAREKMFDQKSRGQISLETVPLMRRP
jgi:hypothetical protein